MSILPTLLIARLTVDQNNIPPSPMSPEEAVFNSKHENTPHSVSFFRRTFRRRHLSTPEITAADSPEVLLHKLRRTLLVKLQALATENSLSLPIHSVKDLSPETNPAAQKVLNSFFIRSIYHSTQSAEKTFQLATFSLFSQIKINFLFSEMVKRNAYIRIQEVLKILHSDPEKYISFLNINSSLNYKSESNQIKHFTFLELAYENRRYESFKCLLEAPSIDLTAAIDLHKRTLLFRAFEYKATSFLSLLLDDGRIDPNTPSSFFLSPLHMIKECSDSNALHILMRDPRVDLNIKNSEGDAPFHLFMKNPFITNIHRSNLKEFIQNPRIDLNIRDTLGNTPLHLLFMKMNEGLANQTSLSELATFILLYFQESRADPNLLNNEGKAPIHYAQEKILYLDFEALASTPNFDPNIQTNTGVTLLHQLCDSSTIYFSYLDRIQMLLEHPKTNLYALDHKNRLALNCALDPENDGNPSLFQFQLSLLQTYLKNSRFDILFKPDRQTTILARILQKPSFVHYFLPILDYYPDAHTLLSIKDLSIIPLNHIEKLFLSHQLNFKVKDWPSNKETLLDEEKKAFLTSYFTQRRNCLYKLHEKYNLIENLKTHSLYLFVFTVLISDDYLIFPTNKEKKVAKKRSTFGHLFRPSRSSLSSPPKPLNDIQRFFKIATALPIELQMQLAQCAYYLPATQILSKDSEPIFQKVGLALYAEEQGHYIKLT